MIFSTETRENYWILACLLNNYDISILSNILYYKKLLENKYNLNWHNQQGFKLKRLKFLGEDKSKCTEILFVPIQSETKLFHLKILVEVFNYPGFILIQGSEYRLPNLREIANTLNFFIEKYGIYEIYSKLFHHTTSKITDNVGNQCIRSIIRIIDNDIIIYEYKTIAVDRENGETIYFEPIERRPQIM